MVGQDLLIDPTYMGDYDSLASDGATTYPGVGLSLGVTRLLGRLFGAGLLDVTRKVPTCVLVALPFVRSKREQAFQE